MSDQDLAESLCCVCAWDHQQLNEFLPISKGPRFPVRGGLGTCVVSKLQVAVVLVQEGQSSQGFCILAYSPGVGLHIQIGN